MVRLPKIRHRDSAGRFSRVPRTDRYEACVHWAVFWLVMLVVFLLALLLMSPGAFGQGPCGPAGCSTGGCPPGIGVGIQGPYGGWAGARAAPGRGVQAGVGGPYGGVIGAQVGPGPRVQAGVIPPEGGRVEWSGQAPATAPPWQPAHLCRLGKGGVSFVGSGALVDSQLGVVVFASHQLHPGDGETGLIVRTADGTLHQARRGPADEANDVALLLIGPVNVPAIGVAASVGIGERVILNGWPMGAGPSAVTGTVSERATITGSARNGQYQRSVGGEGAMIVVRFPRDCQPGESGGPIVNQQGQLVGILSGHDGTACGPEAINRLLDRLAPLAESGPPTPGPDYLPPRPVKAVTRDEFTAAMDSLKARDQEIVDRLMIHSEALAEITGRLDAGGGVGPPGPQGPAGKDGKNADPAQWAEIEDTLTHVVDDRINQMTARIGDRLEALEADGRNADCSALEVRVTALELAVGGLPAYFEIVPKSE